MHFLFLTPHSIITCSCHHSAYPGARAAEKRRCGRAAAARARAARGASRERGIITITLITVQFYHH